MQNRDKHHVTFARYLNILCRAWTEAIFPLVSSPCFLGERAQVIVAPPAQPIYGIPQVK